MAYNSEETMMNRLMQLKADTDLEFMKEFLGSAPNQLQEDFTLLAQSIHEGNSAKRKFHAHKLKGLLLTIGADAASATCVAIEGFSGGNDDGELRSLFAGLETEVKDVLGTMDRITPVLLNE